MLWHEEMRREHTTVCAPVGAPVGASVGAPVGGPFGDPVGAPIGAPVGASVGAPRWCSRWDPAGAPVGGAAGAPNIAAGYLPGFILIACMGVQSRDRFRHPHHTPQSTHTKPGEICPKQCYTHVFVRPEITHSSGPDSPFEQIVVARKKR